MIIGSSFCLRFRMNQNIYRIVAFFLCLVLLGCVLKGWEAITVAQGVTDSSTQNGETLESSISPSPETELAQNTTGEASASAEQPVKKKKSSLLDMFFAAGIVGYVIVLLSFIAVALIIEQCISIREKVLIPPGLADEVAQKLHEGKWQEAAQICRDDTSVLGIVLSAGMNESELGWHSVEKGVEDAVAEQAARLYRRTEYLNLIGNIAPMLGLLGTVIGMVVAFRDLEGSVGIQQRIGDLSQGIYLALITTVEGLVVAIPTIGAYAIFNNRIAYLIAETTYIADQVLRPVKKRLLKRTK